MANCLYCYSPLADDQQDYHPKCSKTFFGTKTVPTLPYKLDEMEQLAKEAIELSVSVPGVQPKLSLGWLKKAMDDGHQNRLTIFNALNGDYILKPPNAQYEQMPENEHVSMLLAAKFGLSTVPSSLIRLSTGELCYITQRIDRQNDGGKIHMIDFLQILELEDKYKGTMEQLGKKVGELSVNTLLDKLRFFELAVFNYIIGNNDMHLKNFSMLHTEIGWVLSPAYDLLNVKLVLPKDKEDMALNFGGKKMNFNKGYFDRFADVMQLNDKQTRSVYKRLSKWLIAANSIIDSSFLNNANKAHYKKLIAERCILFTDKLN